jgi:hypothetical protein
LSARETLARAPLSVTTDNRTNGDLTVKNLMIAAAVAAALAQ